MGPRPPVSSTSPARPAAMRKASMLASRSSAMVVCQPTATPISARRRLSHWLLVSRFWPLVSSLPMERISLFMGPGSGAGRAAIIPAAPPSAPSAAGLERLPFQAALGALQGAVDVEIGGIACTRIGLGDGQLVVLVGVVAAETAAAGGARARARPGRRTSISWRVLFSAVSEGSYRYLNVSGTGKPSPSGRVEAAASRQARQNR